MKIEDFPNAKPAASEHWSGMNTTLWKSMCLQWEWYCKLSSELGGEPRWPKIAKPITQDQLNALRFRAERKLPKEFEVLLAKFSQRVEFFWEVPDIFDESPIEESFTFGGGVLWDYSYLAECCRAMVQHESSPWLAFRDGLRDRLPFHYVGNGDLLALCMRKSESNCPVIYLSHDNDPDDHNRQLAPNIVDFIANWSAIGCVGTDLYKLDRFINKRDKRLNGYGNKANKFRKDLLSFLISDIE